MNPFSWLGIRTKAASAAAITFPQRALSIWWLWGQRDYVRAAGTGRQNSIVEACVRWGMRTFPEAPVRAVQIDAEGAEKPLPHHPLTQLLQRPNPYYGGELLWGATYADYTLSGNSYWLKQRAGTGPTSPVVALWWVPSALVEPRWPESDPSVYISHYDYKPTAETPVQVAPSDIVHFRNGLDPLNIRKGLSPLNALAREIVSDDEAAQWTAALLHNMGVPGLVLVPGPETAIGPDEAEQIKQTFAQKTTGDRRGEPVVLDSAIDIKTVGFSPEQMMPHELRAMSETRISGVLGIPAIVAGLESGLRRSCVPGDARVQTPDGPKAITDLHAGAVVWSFKAGQIVPRAIEHLWPARRDTVYEIRSRNRVLRATGNHPLMVRVPGHSQGGNAGRRPRYEWRPVERLAPGDYVVFAKGYPDQGGTLLPDGRPATAAALQFFGAIIGDGAVRPGVGVRMAMPPADRCQPHYVGLAEALFTKQTGGGVRLGKRATDGLTDVIVARRAAGMSYKAIGREVGLTNASVRDRYLTATQPKPVETAPIVIQTRERDFGFSSAAGSQWLATLGLSGRALTKRVPSWVYALSRDLRLAFLAGIVDTDGSIDARGALTITFANRALVEDVRDLLIGLGFRASNLTHRRMTPDVLPNRGTREYYENWSFTCSSAVQVAEIPFADPLYRERVNANPQRERGDGGDAWKAGLSDDLGFMRVQRITPLGEMDVFDLTVEDGHSFFCENVLVSNTYANFSEARQAAYEGNILPTQRQLAGDLRVQLVPDFGNADTMAVSFDTSRIRVLMEDENAKLQRVLSAVGGPLMTLNEGRAASGLAPLPGQTGEVVYVPIALTPTPVELLVGLGPPTPAVPPPPPAALPPGAEKRWGRIKAITSDPPPFDVARWVSEYRQIRQTLESDAFRSLRGFFAEQRDRILQALDAAGPDASVNDLINTTVEAARLRLELDPHYLEALTLLQNAVQTQLGIRYAFSDQQTQTYLATCGEQIVGITETTRDAVRDSLLQSADLGESPAEQAARLRQSTAFSPQRARLVSRSEMGRSANEATYHNFAASDVVTGVTVLDGDYDDICAEADGTELTMDEFADYPRVAHPACVRAFAPRTAD